MTRSPVANLAFACAYVATGALVHWIVVGTPISAMTFSSWFFVYLWPLVVLYMALGAALVVMILAFAIGNLLARLDK